MTLQEIKKEVENGNKVYHQTFYYEVIKDSKNQWMIKGNNGYCIGLTWADNTTLNGKEEDFFTNKI